MSIINAAKNADWQQVVQNQGPPCFHLEGQHFCLRAHRWKGHDVDHRFIALHEMIDAVMKEKKESCARIVDELEKQYVKEAAQVLEKGKILMGHRQLVAAVCAAMIREKA